jgi:hypothetical protein
MGMAFNIVGMFIAIYAIDRFGLQVLAFRTGVICPARKNGSHEGVIR